MSFSTNINKFLIISALLSGCVAPSGNQDAGNMEEKFQDDSMHAVTSDSVANVGFEAMSGPDTNKIKPELITSKMEKFRIEPTKMSEPTIEQRQINLDTFSILNRKHNDDDSSDEHKKRCYEFQSRKVKTINDTISLIDEKFKKIEERIRNKK